MNLAHLAYGKLPVDSAPLYLFLSVLHGGDINNVIYILYGLFTVGGRRAQCGRHAVQEGIQRPGAHFIDSAIYVQALPHFRQMGDHQMRAVTIPHRTSITVVTGRILYNALVVKQ